MYLELPTLKYRCLRGDMTEVFKITHNIYDSQVSCNRVMVICEMWIVKVRNSVWNTLWLLARKTHNSQITRRCCCSSNRCHIRLHAYSYKCSAVAEMGDHLATIDMGRKFGGCVACACLGGAGSPSNTMWPEQRPTVPSRILIHPAVWPQ